MGYNLFPVTLGKGDVRASPFLVIGLHHGVLVLSFIY